MFDRLLALLPPRFHRDVVLIALAVSVAWVTFGFNSRLDAAEREMSNVAQNERSIAEIKSDEAVVKQQVSDINQNVALLVTVVVGQQAVAHHATPSHPPR